MVLHDWSRSTRVDGPARCHIDASWQHNLRPGDLAAVITAMGLNPLIRMAFSIVHLGVSLLEGSKVRNALVGSIDPFRVEFGVSPPSPSKTSARSGRCWPGATRVSSSSLRARERGPRVHRRRSRRAQ